MELTLKNIVEKLDLKFCIGDNYLLKKAMLKDDNEFLRFIGKEQFDEKVKAIYNEIDIFDLALDFQWNCRIANSVFRFCKEYKRIGNKTLVRFKYDDGINEGKYIGHEFKILDGITRPICDPFWNTYLPPNYIGDNCRIRFVMFEDITPIPKNLPFVENRFIYDLKTLFFDHIQIDVPPKSSYNDNKELLKAWGIDIEQLVTNVFIEVQEKEGKKFTSEEKEKYLEVIKREMKKE